MTTSTTYSQGAAVIAWQIPQAASALNAGGIAAGRLLTADLVIDRFLSVRAATIATIEQASPEQWSAPLPFPFIHLGTT